MIDVETVIAPSIWDTLVAFGGLSLLFIVWLVLPLIAFVADLRARFIWVGSIASLIVIPVFIYGFGRLGTQMFDAFGADALAKATDVVTGLAFSIAIAVGLGRLVEVWILATTPVEEDADVENRLPQLVRLILYGLCVLGGTAVYLTMIGYRPTELYVSTGVLAAIFAFASQQTLGDFFAGITLSIEKPFKLGDWIILADGTEGGVTDINWRTTRLRQWDNATLIVPNSVLAKMQIRNMHDKHHIYSPWYMIQISADHDPRAVKVILLEAALRCKHTVPGRRPTIRLSNASKAPYTYMVWVHFPNYPAMFAGKEELFREIHHGLAAAGIQVAVDIQETRYARAHHPMIEPPNIRMALQSLDFAAFLSSEDLEDIASGVVEVTVATGPNKRRVFDELKPGQYFGLAAMLTRAPAAMQYTASTDVTVIRVDIECLRRVLGGREDITQKFAELFQNRRRDADEARNMAPDMREAVTLQDLVRRVDRAFRAPRT